MARRPLRRSDPREEPSALVAHAGICAGGGPSPQWRRAVPTATSDRRGSHEHERFTFLGYTFRPRLARSKRGGEFVNFLPAIGDDERKRIGRVIRRWRLHRWSGSTLTDPAEAINAEVQGW
jgi:RNA-directed DNA polymerase